MRRVFVVVLFISIFSTMEAFAQQRVWISSTGTDAGACSLAAPCRTISFALSVVLAGGDIVMVDSAGFGSSIVINKAVNIYGPPGVFGSITTLTPSAIGIQVAAGLNDIVRLKGLTILGQGTANGEGIDCGSSPGGTGRTELQDIHINNFAVGVKVSTDVHVNMDGLFISNTSDGIWSRGSNTPAGPTSTSPTLKVLVKNTRIIGTGIGVQLDSGSFLMDSATNYISFATTDQYMIAAIVPNCSSIGNWNGQMNNFTGSPISCGMSCTTYVEDLRNGMMNLGNCNAN